MSEADTHNLSSSKLVHQAGRSVGPVSDGTVWLPCARAARPAVADPLPSCTSCCAQALWRWVPAVAAAVDPTL